MRKLNEYQVCECRFLYSTNKLSIKELAKKYNLTKNAIEGIVYGKTWKMAGGKISIREDFLQKPIKILMIDDKFNNVIFNSEDEIVKYVKEHNICKSKTTSNRQIINNIYYAIDNLNNKFYGKLWYRLK